MCMYIQYVHIIKDYLQEEGHANNSRVIKTHGYKALQLLGGMICDNGNFVHLGRSRKELC